MSNITIIVDDNAIYLDGGYIDELDFSTAGIPTNVHALQWKTNVGWIEFKPNIDWTHDPNEIINTLPDWANNCIAIFNTQLAANKVKMAELHAQGLVNKPRPQPGTTGTTVV